MNFLESLGLSPEPWNAVCLHEENNKCHCGYVFDAEGIWAVCKVPHNDIKSSPFSYESIYPDVPISMKNNNARLIEKAPELVKIAIGRYNGTCFCDKGLGNPMMNTHSDHCLFTQKTLKEIFKGYTIEEIYKAYRESVE